MNTLSTRLVCLLAGLVVSFACGPARALDRNTRIISCSTCETPIDFRNAAITASYSDQNNLTYAVVGDSNGFSAYVQVSGYWFYDPFTYNQYWTVNTAQAMDQNGGALSSDLPTAQAQMAVVDVGLFGYNRTPTSPKVVAINMPLAYDGSFINSTDEYDSPGIGNALAQLGLNPSDFPVGSKLTVTYADGTKAVFVKVSMTSSYQWAWDGVHAWNANGKPIDRAGNLIANGDRPGKNRTSSRVSSAAKSSLPGRRFCREEEAVFG
jgi:hypothetical protein